jgi:hypothetical protein
VDHFFRPQKLKHLYYLLRQTLDLNFLEPLPPLKHLQQRLVWADLQHDVDVVFIVKKVLELTDMLVLELPVYLDLAHEFLLRSNFGQRGFLNELASDFGA